MSSSSPANSSSANLPSKLGIRLLERSLGLNVFQQPGQLFISKPPLQTWDQTSGLLRRFWTQVGQSCQLKLVQFFTHQKRPDRGDSLSVSKLCKSLGVVESLHEDFRELLLILSLLILLLPVLQQHVHLRNQQSLSIFKFLGECQLCSIFILDNFSNIMRHGSSFYIFFSLVEVNQANN